MKNLIYCGMLIVLFVNSSIGGIPTTSNVIVKQCVDVGGYCQNSWDCCSDRCLSFSYKCVNGPPSSSGSMPNAPILDPSVISVDSLDDLVNRFGGDDDKTLATPTVTSSVSTSTSSSTTHNNSECIGIGYECADSSQCCSNDCLHYMNVNICIEKRNPITTTTTDSPNGQCLQIGQKCYRHAECCSLRCHGYLHQCVT